MSERSDVPRPDEPPGAEPPERERSPESTSELLALAHAPEHVPAEIRDASFTVALRGYNRAEVDDYVERVNRVIAEMEISRSPQNAVKVALDRVGEQTAGVLQRAREAAEELTSTALAESEHAARRARVEAAELIEGAETQSQRLIESSTEEAGELLARARARVTELREEVEELRGERRRVLDQLHATAAALDAFAIEAEREAPAALPAAPTDVGEEDGAPDPAEQPTELRPAIVADGALAPGEEDEASPRTSPPRRVPGGSRSPRTPRREPAEAGRPRRS